jgi:ferredoxin-NADP reductase
MLTGLVEEFSDALVYVCGPPNMCHTIIHDLGEMDVPRTRIRVEEYD